MGKKVKVYDVKKAFMADADNVAMFGMAKAHINAHSSTYPATSYHSVLERILLRRFKSLPQTRYQFAQKLIRTALGEAKSTNAKTISIPKIGLTKVVLADTLSAFVDENFKEMYKEYQMYLGTESNPYPIALTNSVRKVEQRLGIG